MRHIGVIALLLVVTMVIDSETTFAWLVPNSLRKREMIEADVADIARKNSHEFDIEVPASEEYEQWIDRNNSNNLRKEKLW